MPIANVVGSVAAYASTPMAWVCAVVSAVAVQLGDQVASTTPFILTQALYFGTVYLLVDSIGVLVGMNVRTQRERLSAVEERSARLALAREQTALLAASTERSRIAREMHDVVAHSLAVMITMADGAAAAVDRAGAARCGAAGFPRRESVVIVVSGEPEAEDWRAGP